MDNNFGGSLVTNRKGSEPHDFALLLAVLTAHCTRLAMLVISILELASNCCISDIIHIVHHMMDTHHMMKAHYDDEHPSYVGQPSYKSVTFLREKNV